MKIFAIKISKTMNLILNAIIIMVSLLGSRSNCELIEEEYSTEIFTFSSEVKDCSSPSYIEFDTIFGKNCSNPIQNCTLVRADFGPIVGSINRKCITGLSAAPNTVSQSLEGKTKYAAIETYSTPNCRGRKEKGHYYKINVCLKLSKTATKLLISENGRSVDQLFYSDDECKDQIVNTTNIIENECTQIGQSKFHQKLTISIPKPVSASVKVESISFFFMSFFLLLQGYLA